MGVRAAQVLPPATIMVVSVTATTTQGKPLSDDDLRRALEACDMSAALTDAKMLIFTYVESRMHFLAPNLTHICGAPTAAKMMGAVWLCGAGKGSRRRHLSNVRHALAREQGAAGGLTALSAMPACNILVLGANQKVLAGFSAAAAGMHQGFLYFSEIVQRQPAVRPPFFPFGEGCAIAVAPC